MAKEAIFYLDLILEDESDEHPAYLDFQGGKIAEDAGAPPAEIDAEVGPFVLTGIAAAFPMTRVILPTVGAFTLTGIASTFGLTGGIGVWSMFQSFPEALAEQVHDLENDTIKIALTNTLPVATQTTFDPVTNHPPPAADNGYPAGGSAVSVWSSSQGDGAYKLVLNDLQFTADGGDLGPFRYLVLYNDSAENDEVIGWYDCQAPLTLVDEQTITLDFEDAGAITLT